MRGIGKGQTVELLATPEVSRLVDQQVHHGASVGSEAVGTASQGAASQRAVLVEVVAWLTVNALGSENQQFQVLCEQSARNVWRKEAFGALARAGNDAVGSPGAIAPRADGAEPPLGESVLLFAEPVDLSLQVLSGGGGGGGGGGSLSNKLRLGIRGHEKHVRNDAQRQTLRELQALATQAEAKPAQAAADGATLRVACRVRCAVPA